MTSPTASMDTVMTTMLTPSNSATLPNVNRCEPLT